MIAQNALGEFLTDWIYGVVAVLELEEIFGNNPMTRQRAWKS